MTKLKWIVVVILLLVAGLGIYVQTINRNSNMMTYRQKLLKAFYPALVWFGKKNGEIKTNTTNDNQPKMSFYSLSDTLIDGTTFEFSQLKGKKVLLVNTASNCGYTEQYSDLQKLFSQSKDELVVIGFPANDFKEQEKGSNADINEFCKKNFGVNFPLMKKSSVIKSQEQNSVYKWLTDSSLNGWNNKPPSWNFSKYLINENGKLTHYFDPGISPLSDEVIAAIGEK